MDAPTETFHLQPISVPMPFQSNDVYMYLYDGGETLTLFDAALPTDDAWDRLERALAERGRTVRDIGRIILTHHHFDHTGLAGRLAAETGAELCGHPEVAAAAALTYTYDEAHTAWMRGLLLGFGVPEDLVEQIVARRPLMKPFVHRVDRLDRALADGEMVDGFRVVHVPGHSPTDTLFVHEELGFSITGDHILEHVTPNPILRRPPVGQPRARSLVEFEASLRRTRALELGWCFPGHGKPFDDHRPVVDRILSTHEKRSQRLLAWLRCPPPQSLEDTSPGPADLPPSKGDLETPSPGTAGLPPSKTAPLPPSKGDNSVTPYEAALHLYPRMGSDLLFFCMSATVGQLELLESQGLAVSSTKNGVLRYAPVTANEPEGER